MPQIKSGSDHMIGKGADTILFIAMASIELVCFVLHSVLLNSLYPSPQILQVPVNVFTQLPPAASLALIYGQGQTKRLPRSFVLSLQI